MTAMENHKNTIHKVMTNKGMEALEQARRIVQEQIEYKETNPAKVNRTNQIRKGGRMKGHSKVDKDHMRKGELNTIWQAMTRSNQAIEIKTLKKAIETNKHKTARNDKITYRILNIGTNGQNKEIWALIVTDQTKATTRIWDPRTKQNPQKISEWLETAREQEAGDLTIKSIGFELEERHTGQAAIFWAIIMQKGNAEGKEMDTRALPTPPNEWFITIDKILAGDPIPIQYSDNDNIHQEEQTSDPTIERINALNLATYRTEIKKSKIVENIPGREMGVFAKRTIKEGTDLGEYTGENITMNELDNRHPEEADYAYTLRNGTCIDAHDPEKGSMARWVNHSKKPNAIMVEIQGKLRLIAAEQIQTGMEILIDYNPQDDKEGYEWATSPNKRGNKRGITSPSTMIPTHQIAHTHPINNKDQSHESDTEHTESTQHTNGLKTTMDKTIIQKKGRCCYYDLSTNVSEISCKKHPACPEHQEEIEKRNKGCPICHDYPEIKRKNPVEMVGIKKKVKKEKTKKPTNDKTRAKTKHKKIWKTLLKVSGVYETSQTKPGCMKA
jgi:hypothetical protein